MYQSLIKNMDANGDKLSMKRTGQMYPVSHTIDTILGSNSSSLSQLNRDTECMKTGKHIFHIF